MLTPALFTILSGLVEERVGLYYRQEDSELFAERVVTRARLAGFDSLLDYYYYLRYDPSSGQEFEGLVDALVVRETFFFRELPALSAAVETLVPTLRAGQNARIWCAACASGDEPLTVAMLLADKDLQARSEIVATDVSLQAFYSARASGWSSRSLRGSPPPLAERFLRDVGGRIHVQESLIEAVDFRRINLLDAAAIAALGRFDLIVCRNVLIYFSNATILNVLSHISNALRPEGRLLVGSSESLMRFGTLFDVEERAGVFLYKRSGLLR